MISRYELFSTAVSCLCRDIQKIERMEMRKFGLKGPHAQCLLVMNRYPQGITAAQLVELCSRDKADVSRAMALLEKKGLVRKEEPEGKAYRVLLSLTDAGRDVACQINVKAQAAVERASYGLPAEKREIFYESLELITGNLQKLSKIGLDGYVLPEESREDANDSNNC